MHLSNSIIDSVLTTQTIEYDEQTHSLIFKQHEIDMFDPSHVNWEIGRASCRERVL